MNLSLQDEILLLRAQVDYLLERCADQPQLTDRPVNWSALDGTAAAEQWDLLTEWTDWLRQRYQLQESIPNCWYAHGPMIEELSALRTAWAGAYLAPDAQLSDPLGWHDALDRALYRLRQWDRNGCRDGTHRPDVLLPDDTDGTDRKRVVNADLAQRNQEGHQP
jgi:hypothetical protein